MDSAYLRANVGDALTKGLSAVAVNQPADSVEYLGKYLLNYVACKQKELEIEELRQGLIQQKADAAVKAVEDAATADETAKAATAKIDEVVSLKKSLAGAKDVAAMYPTVLDQVRAQTGASSVYVSRKEKHADESEQLQFVAATKENEDILVGNVLKAGSGEEEDPENPPAEQGVTFKLWQVPTDAPEVLDEEGNPVEPVAPSYVHVKNVCRDPSVKFFGVPKLGAYLCVKFDYKSYMHDAAFDVSEDPEVLQTVVRDMVLGLDSMGSGKCFTDEQVATAQEWAGLLAASMEQAEAALFATEGKTRASAKAWNSDSAMQVDGEKEKAQAAMDAAVAEIDADAAKEPLEDGTVQAISPEDAATKKEDAKLKMNLGIYSLYKQGLNGHLKKFKVTPKPAVIKAIEGTLQLLQYDSADYYNKGSGTVDWTRMSGLLNAELDKKIKGFSPEERGILKSNEGLEAIKAGLDEVAAEEVAASDVAVAVQALQAWTVAAIEASLVAATQAQEAADAAEAAAAAAAEGEGA